MNGDVVTELDSAPRQRRIPRRPHMTAMPGLAEGVVALPYSSATGNRRTPQLLFLGQTLPYPPDGGVNIRMYNVLRLLSAAFDVTALCFYRQAERPRAADVEASIAGLRPFATVEAFPIPQEQHRAMWMVWDHLRSVARRRPYTWYSYASAPFRERLLALMTRQRFDLVQIDSLDLACYLPLLHRVPVVCVHHKCRVDPAQAEGGS